MKLYKPKNLADYKFLAYLWSNPKNNQFMLTKKLTVDGVKKHLADKRRHIYILENEGKLIGTFNIAKQDKDQGRFGIIIDHKFQGKGFGKEAMELLEKEAKKLGIKKLKLEVFAQNKKAINLYKKMGYQESGRWITMGKKMS